ncbi:MAG: peptidoglycan DD-metalloendopeptidase family protein [Congregibacter sp.]
MRSPEAPARLKAALCLFASMFIVACGSRAPAPIVDHSARSEAPIASTYTVLSGDTLYAIAFRYGLDLEGLAAANRIARPYTIFPGQRLVLVEAAPNRVARTASGQANSPDTQSPSAPSAAAPRPKAERSSADSGGTSQPSTASAEPVVPKVTDPPATPKATRAAKPNPPNVSVSGWRWPARGRLTRGFDGDLHKGIDISGKRGDPILASAAGRVVYAGSGIAGYGLMLIIRHNDTYLSAYGHNDSLLVSEGEDVSAGQRIAKRGSSGTDTVKLHFEIRRQGRPIDPLRLLPKP